MPIYEYHCAKCGTMEITQRITEKALTRCPDCKGKIKRLISHTSFQLKGTGWYITDYARKGGAPKEEKKTPTSDGAGNAKPAVEKSSAEKATGKTASTSAE